jgi:hypothetical protein
MSEIWMLLPDPGAATFIAAVDALARNRQPGDDRTADQRRADAAVQLALNTLHGDCGGQLPREHGMRPAVQVTVALSTLLRLDEQPGDLDGTGAIPATVARRIAADETGTWRRLITDPVGRLVDYGRSTYRSPKNLADYGIARDRTCRSPHCNRNAKRCELDHQTPWAQGGTTNADSLNSLCPRHHHARHEADWTPHRQPDGTVEWTSPTGHRYVDPPATYPIDRTTELTRPTETSPTEANSTDPDPPPF